MFKERYYKERAFEAESRAVTHFMKLIDIEKTLLNAEKTKEPSVFTVEKIKAIIYQKHTDR